MSEISNEIPLMKFEGDASAPILRYDIPSPSSYEGRNYIELDIAGIFFKPETKEKPDFNELVNGFLNNNQREIDEFLTRITSSELQQLGYSTTMKSLKSVDNRIQNPTGTAPRVGVANFGNTGVIFAATPGTNVGTPGGGSVPGKDLFNDQLMLALKDTLASQDEPDRPADPEIFDIERKYNIFRARLELAIHENQFPAFYKSMGGNLKLKFVDVPAKPEPRLILIESCSLTSYPGDYGAGTTIKTFSLLPSENTEISIKTWKKSVQTKEEASSILDSFTSEKADEFERGVQSENSNQEKVEESFSYHAEAEAKASWGWGSAKVSGGVAGSSNSARESISKDVMNATETHSQKASAKREVNIDTSYSRTDETETEEVITRTIQNLNASRVLNFVFRQMNQEFHSILHLKDLRVAFFNGYPGSMKEYPLYELGELVKEFMEKEVVAANAPGVNPNLVDSGKVQVHEFLEQLLLDEYGPRRVLDYQGNFRQLIERNKIPAPEINPEKSHSYLRIIPPGENEDGSPTGRQEYVMRRAIGVEQPKDSRFVDGIILSARKLTLKTDGVIVESLLGKAPALDKYALNTQIEVLKEKELSNSKSKLGLDIIASFIENGNLEDAVNAYYKLLVPQPKEEKSSE